MRLASSAGEDAWRRFFQPSEAVTTVDTAEVCPLAFADAELGRHYLSTCDHLAAARVIIPEASRGTAHLGAGHDED
jgi:hypothetical protein